MANFTPKKYVEPGGSQKELKRLAAVVNARRGAAQVDSVAADVATLRTDFNALLAKLRAGDIIASA